MNGLAISGIVIAAVILVAVLYNLNDIMRYLRIRSM
jgi:hypothetical protein